MKKPISFSGLSVPTQVQVPETSSSWSFLANRDVSGTVQGLFQYIGHIWLAHHKPPLTAKELATFRIEEVIHAYCSYRFAGGTILLDQGLDLEKTYLLTQIISRKPFTCLINKDNELEDVSTPWMTHILSLPAQELLGRLQKRCPVRINTKRGIQGQIDRWGNLSPKHVALIYDGKIGHCIIFCGIEYHTDRWIFWDPRPLRSLLCKENNQAGVSAEPVSSKEPFWTISAEECTRVLYAVFVPQPRW